MAGLKGFDAKREDIIQGLILINEKNLQTIPDFMANFSNRLDQLILQTEIDELVSFGTGSVMLKLVNYDQMKLVSDLYFKNNSDGNWLNKKIETQVMDIDLYLLDAAKDELLKKKEIQFDIDKPGE